MKEKGLCRQGPGICKSSTACAACTVHTIWSGGWSSSIALHHCLIRQVRIQCIIQMLHHFIRQLYIFSPSRLHVISCRLMNTTRAARLLLWYEQVVLSNSLVFCNLCIYVPSNWVIHFAHLLLFKLTCNHKMMIMTRIRAGLWICRVALWPWPWPICTRTHIHW